MEIDMDELHFGPLTFVPGENSGRYPFCHSLYINGDKKIIIDPASKREKLLELKEGPGVDVAWLSHYHEDHFIYLELFSDKELWMSGPDAPALENIDNILDLYGIEDKKERELWGNFMVESFNYRPRKVDRIFDENEVIDLGSVNVEVISAPGHTAGNLAFYFREVEVLFIGDYDLLKFGPWYGDRDSDIDQTIASAQKLRKIPAKVWITSHDKGVYLEDPGHLWDDFLDVIFEREAKLLELLSKPRTTDEIVEARIVYKKPREPKLFYEFGERALMKKHLDRLMSNGEVKKEGDRYQIV
jgi:hydroxyacylglutathione hydrolase